MMKIIDGKLIFTHCNPSKHTYYDDYGDIDWVLEKENAVCQQHGVIPLEQVGLSIHSYDESNWEIPACPHCGQWFLGLPVDDSARKIVEKRRATTSSTLQ